MKLGMPTLIELPDVYRTVELCEELKLSFVELNMNIPDFCPENLPCFEAIFWASQAGINLINLHINSGVYFTLPYQKIWIYEKYKKQFLLNIENAFLKLLEIAKKSKVMY